MDSHKIKKRSAWLISINNKFKSIARFMGSKSGSDRIIAYLFVLPAIIVVLGVYGYPIIRAFFIGFHDWHILDKIGTYVGIENYSDLLFDPEFWRAVGVTVAWVGGTLVLQLLLGISGALLLNEPLLGKNVARGLILFPWIMPTVVAAIVFRFMFNDLYGLINYFLLSIGLIKQPIVWLGTPGTALMMIIIIATWKWFSFFVLIFLGRLQTISEELYESAKMDGASAWQSFVHITLPLLKPVIYIALLLRTIWLFGKFDIVWLFTHGGPGNATTTLPIFIYKEAFEHYDLGRGSAIAFLQLVLLTGLLLVYLQRYMKAEENIQ